MTQVMLQQMFTKQFDLIRTQCNRTPDIEKCCAHNGYSECIKPVDLNIYKDGIYPGPHKFEIEESNTYEEYVEQEMNKKKEIVKPAETKTEEIVKHKPDVSLLQKVSYFLQRLHEMNEMEEEEREGEINTYVSLDILDYLRVAPETGNCLPDQLTKYKGVFRLEGTAWHDRGKGKYNIFELLSNHSDLFEDVKNHSCGEEIGIKIYKFYGRDFDKIYTHNPTKYRTFFKPVKFSYRDICYNDIDTKPYECIKQLIEESNCITQFIEVQLPKRKEAKKQNSADLMNE